MSDPGMFWNLSDISVKKRVQDTIFPEGVVCDFNTGFGTVKLAESYQLSAQITEVIKKQPDEHAADLVMNTSLAPPIGRSS